MSDTNHSVFYPLAVVLVAFCVFYSMDSYSLLQQRKQAKASLEQMELVLPQAQQVNETLRNLTGDVLMLSDRSPGARQVIKEFRIKAQISEP